MRHGIPHQLPPEQLRVVVRKFAEVYCERFKEREATASWLGDDRLEVSVRAKGIPLRATLTLMPEELSIEMEVPLALRFFKGRALRAIEEEVRPWLDAAARGELI